MIAPASQRVIMQPRAGRCVDRGGSAQAPNAAVRQETGSGAAAEKALSVTAAIKNRDSYDSTVSQDLPAISSCANAVFNATGVRVREFPITLDKLLPGLPFLDT
jgi:hypothetical protein